ncbi:oligosaccharide flippase family protein [Salmonella enterica]|nr:oligosaccharide flippase family protein [Salmonella enterica]
MFILGVLPLFFCVTNVNYYFIAQQNFKMIFYLNVLSKLFFTIVVFIVIYLKLPLSLVVMGMNGWYTTSSVVGLFLLRKVIRDSPIKDSEGAINLKEGISLFKIIMPGFSSSLASLFLTMLVQPFMAIVTSNNYSIIAIYSICDKCIRAATGFLDSINNVLYSKISSLEQLIEKKKIVFKAMTFYLLIEFFGLLLLYLLFPYLTSYIEKFRKYQDLLGLVFLITPIIMVITLGNIFSSLILFTSGIFKEVTYTIILSSAIFMTIIFIPYNLKNIEYFLFALLLSEGISTILKGMLVWKKTKFFK